MLLPLSSNRLLIRRVEPRFAGFDEVQLKEGKRDRAMQEVFICENSIALDKLPLKEFEQEWNRTHLSAWKKTHVLVQMMFR